MEQEIRLGILPFSVFEHVVSYLGILDICRLSQSSKAFINLPRYVYRRHEELFNPNPPFYFHQLASQPSLDDSSLMKIKTLFDFLQSIVPFNIIYNVMLDPFSAKGEEFDSPFDEAIHSDNARFILQLSQFGILDSTHWERLGPLEDERMVTQMVQRSRDLMAACVNGDNATVVEILEDETTLFAPNYLIHFSETPIHNATVTGNISENTIKLLVSKGAFINANTECGTTPLHLAIIADRTPAFIDWMLENGADPRAAEEYDGMPPFFSSFTRPDPVAFINVFLRHDPTIVRATDNRGYGPFHVAISAENNLQVFDTLLEAGADLTLKDQEGNTALHLALKIGQEGMRLDLIQWIIRNNHSLITIGNGQKETPLHLAMKQTNTDLATFLIANGADLDAQDSLGNTPLHWAVKFAPVENRAELIQILLSENKLLIDVQNEEKMTAVDLASRDLSGEERSAILEYFEKIKGIESKWFDKIWPWNK
jgi:ankyrin repeat protein